MRTHRQKDLTHHSQSTRESEAQPVFLFFLPTDFGFFLTSFSLIPSETLLDYVSGVSFCTFPGWRKAFECLRLFLNFPIWPPARRSNLTMAEHREVDFFSAPTTERNPKLRGSGEASRQPITFTSYYNEEQA